MWAVFVLFIAYPLSTGPVLCILKEVGELRSDSAACDFILDVFYAPLVHLSDHCQPLQDFLESYVKLWGLP